jgi:hypothetical protein
MLLGLAARTQWQLKPRLRRKLGAYWDTMFDQLMYVIVCQSEREVNEWHYDNVGRRLSKEDREKASNQSLSILQHRPPMTFNRP